MHPRLVPWLAALALFVATACAGDEPPATPTPTVAPTSPAVTASPTRSATASPTATGQALPSVVRAVIDDVAEKDVESLVGRAEYQQVGCTTAQGAGGPPKCRPGDAPGTVYRVFATGTCQGEWVADAEPALRRLLDRPLRLYAAAHLRPPSPDPEPEWPKGRYAVVFTNTEPGTPNPPGVYFILDDDGVVRAHAICGPGQGPGTEARLLQDLGATAFLVPPPS